jgi:hypothetical protein
MTTSPARTSRERGSGLIIVIMIVAFMLAVGMLLLSVTATSPKVSDDIRLQGLAFDAAEAGFDAAWAQLNGFFLGMAYTSFSGHYHADYNGTPGTLDDPGTNDQPNPFYFRNLTDEQIVADCLAHRGEYANTLIFNSEPLSPDPADPAGPTDLVGSYTVFLINDEGAVPDDHDCIMVCIGRYGTLGRQGRRDVYKRLEIVIEVGS